MATALAKGFLQSRLTTDRHLIASDVIGGARDAFHRETGARTTERNTDVVSESDLIIIAVKPDQVAGVLQELRGAGTPRHLVLSIAAGVTLASLEAAAWPGARMIRVMPNTPALVGASASAYALGSHATRTDAELASRLLGSVGIALEVREKLLDAVTGLSGSGPAYGFILIEALADGGVAAGLPRDTATRLAAQTLLGAARMVLETGQHPAALKDAVCSPGGTTIDGVHELEKGGVRAALIQAVRTAADKSRALGR